MGLKLVLPHWGKGTLCVCVFENRVLRDIFGCKRVEETGNWKKLHDFDLSLSIILMRWRRNVVHVG
jgi:hypothetical protein